MGHPVSIPTIGRTVVVGGYGVALVVVGEPVWLAVLLGVTLLLVWAAPLVVAPPRHRSAAVPVSIPVVGPKEAGPS
jgi:hypothetical protein